MQWFDHFSSQYIHMCVSMAVVLVAFVARNTLEINEIHF